MADPTTSASAGDSVPGQLEEIRKRLDKGDRRFETLETAVRENTEITKDIRDAVVAGRVATKLIKWLGAVALAVSAIWALVHQVKAGHPPIK